MDLTSLEKRIKALEENQIDSTMNYKADSNVLRSVNRALVTKTLKIGQAGTPASSLSALLELSSITRGLVLSRMTTTQRNAIVNPTAGLVIYNTTTNKVNVYTTGWEAITSA